MYETTVSYQPDSDWVWTYLVIAFTSSSLNRSANAGIAPFPCLTIWAIDSASSYPWRAIALFFRVLPRLIMLPPLAWQPAQCKSNSASAGLASANVGGIATTNAKRQTKPVSVSDRQRAHSVDLNFVSFIQLPWWRLDFISTHHIWVNSHLRSSHLWWRVNRYD